MRGRRIIVVPSIKCPARDVSATTTSQGKKADSIGYLGRINQRHLKSCLYERIQVFVRYVQFCSSRQNLVGYKVCAILKQSLVQIFKCYLMFECVYVDKLNIIHCSPDRQIILFYWWFACDVMASMLVDRSNKVFLLWELTSLFMQTL